MGKSSAIRNEWGIHKREREGGREGEGERGREREGERERERERGREREGERERERMCVCWGEQRR
jgi:hypothetical protein